MHTFCKVLGNTYPELWKSSFFLTSKQYLSFYYKGKKIQKLSFCSLCKCIFHYSYLDVLNYHTKQTAPSSFISVSFYKLWTSVKTLISSEWVATPLVFLLNFSVPFRTQCKCCFFMSTVFDPCIIVIFPSIVYPYLCVYLLWHGSCDFLWDYELYEAK